jgi:hypothetical protein
MTKAIHCICHRTGLLPLGMDIVDSQKGLYSSKCWIVDSPQELVGGWLYLHEAGAEGAHFGGFIEDIQTCTTDQNRPGVAFIVRKDPRATHQKWRGPTASQSHVFNIIEKPDYAHERERPTERQ